MKKDIYELLNEVDTDIDSYTPCELTQDEKKQILNNDILKHKLFKEKKQMRNINNRMIKRILATAACAVLVASTSLGSVTAFATTNPIAHSIANVFGLTNNLDDYATVINQGETKDGITVSLGEVVYDRENNKLIVATSITSEDAVIEEGRTWSPHLRLYINGEHMNTAQQESQQIVDENTIEFVNVFMLREQFDDDIDVNVYVAGVNVNDVYIEERWEFEFTTNGDELSQSTFTQDIGLPVELGGGVDIMLERLTINPIYTSIFYSTDDLFFGKTVYIRGTDNLGNPVEFHPAPIVEGGYGGEALIDSSEYTLTEEVEFMTLQVYTNVTSENGATEYVPVGTEFIVNVAG